MGWQDQLFRVASVDSSPIVVRVSANERNHRLPLKTPVAFIIFKRPDLTARVWEVLRQVQPQQLFVIADGPRHAEERQACNQTRQVVNAPDWKCDVQRDYSETNLGCRNRIASGLDWVFTRVPEAIILEDDCVPSPDFFRFCTELLERYREQPRVMHIGGSNFLRHWKREPHSYHFSRYAHVWGWATWARAWRGMDLTMKGWKQFKTSGIRELFKNRDEQRHWIRKLNPIANGERTDTWAYPWQYSVWANRGVCVVPQTNLVANIGFREDATHTRQSDSRLGNLPAGEMPSVLADPPAICFDDEADNAVFDQAFGGQRMRLRKSWRYKLSKPMRVYKKLRARWSRSLESG
jgi:hypothetical protein